MDIQTSFRIVKQIKETPIFYYPDLNKPFKVFTDVSDYGIGYYLIQDNSEGNQQIVMLGHRTLKEQEKDMSTIDRELIALELAATKIIYITNE